jgi:threonine dehydrogenase-like Zn-dependent dehydrogenase
MEALILEATVDPRVNCRAAANVRLRDPRIVLGIVSEPGIQEPDDLIVEVWVNGICGSDTHVSECGPSRYVKFSGPADVPVVLGHEFVGKIVDLGKGVSGFRRGDIVAAESIQSCGRCQWCAAGHLNQCEAVQLIGLTINGALSRYVRVKEAHCHNVERILSRFGTSRGADHAALLEPLGCAFNGIFVDRNGLMSSGFWRDDVAAVFGAGPIGLGAVSLLRAAGIDRVVAFDINDERVRLAKKLGASASFNIGKIENLRDFIRDHTGGRLFDLVVEAAGDPSLFGRVIEAMAPRGRLVYLGRTPGKVTFDPNTIVTNAITINGSRGHAGYGIFESLIEMIAEGRLDLDGFVTAHYPFADVLAAFDRARDQRDGKILISVSDGGQ